MNAIDVARWFLLRNDQEVESGDGEFITHLKLQKLLYYAQGICLACFDKPLFDEEIYAWKHGPVVQEVYQVYKLNGSSPINITREDDDLNLFKILDSDESYRKVLEATFENYGKYSAWHLRNLTHNERPWKETPSDQIIEKSLIKEFFKAEIIDYED